MLEENTFKPLRLLKDGWVQTIASVYWPRLPDKRPNESFIVDLPDGDKLVIMENLPRGWRAGDRLVVMVHGLTGCYQSSYMSRLCRRLLEQGYGVVRVNLRNCGPGFGLARQPYHSGRSNDIREVLRVLQGRHPLSPVTVLGFSLGGNIILKMAGEDGSEIHEAVDSMVAVSPPIDLLACSNQLNRPRNKFFDWYFVSRLQKTVTRIHEYFDDMEPVCFPKKTTLRMFDDIYTGPRSGFASGEDYYRQCSALRVIDNIHVPTLILCSKDDPVIAHQPFYLIPRRDPFKVLLTDHGGHIAFLGSDEESPGVRWMDYQVKKWIAGFPARSN